MRRRCSRLCEMAGCGRQWDMGAGRGSEILCQWEDLSMREMRRCVGAGVCVCKSTAVAVPSPRPHVLPLLRAATALRHNADETDPMTGGVRSLYVAR